VGAPAGSAGGLRLSHALAGTGCRVPGRRRAARAAWHSGKSNWSSPQKVEAPSGRGKVDVDTSMVSCACLDRKKKRGGFDLSVALQGQTIK
jgi:hypothetical protein